MRSHPGVMDRIRRIDHELSRRSSDHRSYRRPPGQPFASDSGARYRALIVDAPALLRRSSSNAGQFGTADPPARYHQARRRQLREDSARRGSPTERSAAGGAGAPDLDRYLAGLQRHGAEHADRGFCGAVGRHRSPRRRPSSLADRCAPGFRQSPGLQEPGKDFTTRLAHGVDNRRTPAMTRHTGRTSCDINHETSPSPPRSQRTMLISGAADPSRRRRGARRRRITAVLPARRGPDVPPIHAAQHPGNPRRHHRPPLANLLNGAPPDCYLPIVDPDSRRYLELQIPDVPGVVFGPPLPTCQTPEQTVMPQ